MFFFASNGNLADLEAFPSDSRNAFNGLCLVIGRDLPGGKGALRITAESEGLQKKTVTVKNRN